MRIPSGGRLLDRVAYCMRKPCKASNIIDEVIEVRDAFPYNPESKTAPETAKRWASPYCWEKEDEYVPEVIERDNVPFAITITDLHVRSEGGRAYKVIDSEMRRFDLREDQVLEVMRDVGILPGGKVAGEFVWGILGSQVRLVLVGGDLHRSMVAGAADKKAFEANRSAGLHPTESTLVPGHVYRKKDKSLHAFLGSVKRAGIDKTFYAFIEMPTHNPYIVKSLEELEELEQRFSGNDRRVKSARHASEIHSKWDTLTWREKCKFAWDDQYNKFREPNEKTYVRHEYIMLMSTPKFEADDGVLEADFFEELRVNAQGQHDYVDGNKYSILQKEFKKAYPNERGYFLAGDVWQTYGGWGHQDNSKQMTEALRKMKVDLRKGLVWL